MSSMSPMGRRLITLPNICGRYKPLVLHQCPATNVQRIYVKQTPAVSTITIVSRMFAARLIPALTTKYTTSSMLAVHTVCVVGITDTIAVMLPWETKHVTTSIQCDEYIHRLTLKNRTSICILGIQIMMTVQLCLCVPMYLPTSPLLEVWATPALDAYLFNRRSL
eukprot:PhF_6_TR25491/c1_g1_i3/m.35461